MADTDDNLISIKVSSAENNLNQAKFNSPISTTTKIIPSLITSNQQQQQRLSSQLPSSASSSSTTNNNNNNKFFLFFRIIERNLIYVWSYFRQLSDHRSYRKRSFFSLTISSLIIALYLFNLLMSNDGNSNNNNVDNNLNNKNVNTININSDNNENNYNNRNTLIEYLTFRPGNFLSPQHWIWSMLSIFTYPLIELHWWQVLIDIILLHLSTTLIEPLWGNREILLFFFVVINLTISFLITITYIILYSVYSNSYFLYDIIVYGLSGYCGAITVIVKQLLPESILISTPLGKLKNSHIPLTTLLITYLLYVFNLIDSCVCLRFVYGIIIAWIYLRFFQYHQCNGTRGDLSQAFSFATFFPNVLRPFISLIANLVFNLFVKLRLCSSDLYQYQSLNELSSEQSGGGGNSNGTITGKVFKSKASTSQANRAYNQFKHHQSGDYQHLTVQAL